MRNPVRKSADRKVSAGAKIDRAQVCPCEPYEYVDEYGSQCIGCHVYHEPDEPCRALQIYVDQLLATFHPEELAQMYAHLDDLREAP